MYRFELNILNKTEILYTFRNLLGLLESAIMLQTSALEINL